MEAVLETPWLETVMAKARRVFPDPVKAILALPLETGIVVVAGTNTAGSLLATATSMLFAAGAVNDAMHVPFIPVADVT